MGVFLSGLCITARLYAVILADGLEINLLNQTKCHASNKKLQKLNWAGLVLPSAMDLLKGRQLIKIAGRKGIYKKGSCTMINTASLMCAQVNGYT